MTKLGVCTVLTIFRHRMWQDDFCGLLLNIAAPITEYFRAARHSFYDWLLCRIVVTSWLCMKLMIKKLCSQVTLSYVA